MEIRLFVGNKPSVFCVFDSHQLIFIAGFSGEAGLVLRMYRIQSRRPVLWAGIGVEPGFIEHTVFRKILMDFFSVKMSINLTTCRIRKIPRRYTRIFVTDRHVTGSVGSVFGFMFLFRFWF
jgi:hypothetical protein